MVIFPPRGTRVVAGSGKRSKLGANAENQKTYDYWTKVHVYATLTIFADQRLEYEI